MVVCSLLPLRVATFLVGAFAVVYAFVFPFTISGDMRLLDYAGAIGIVSLPMALGGAFFVTRIAERIVLTADFLEIRNPFRKAARISWTDISAVGLVPDIFTVIPVITTDKGQTRLRGATSFTRRENSAAVRTIKALETRLSC